MEFFLNSSEIDFLVLLYLQECGFNHSFFVFSREANIDLSIENEKIIPPGCLISLIQRGFLYSHLENDWFLKMGKSKKTSIQTFFQKKRKIYQSIKHKISTMDKKFFITSQITNKKAVLFCTWHPRKMKGYYSTRDSLNYLSENKRTLKSYEIFPKNLIFDTEKKNKISYEVTSIDFNLSGTLLSTTCYNGLFTIWTETGCYYIILFFTIVH